jgi:hypothetical protein
MNKEYMTYITMAAIILGVVFMWRTDYRESKKYKCTCKNK